MLSVEERLRDAVYAFRFFMIAHHVSFITDEDVEYAKEATGADLAAHVRCMSDEALKIRDFPANFLDFVEDALDAYQQLGTYTPDAFEKACILWHAHRQSFRERIAS